MGAFADCLLKLRKEAGYPSAYQFYHRNGGRRTFPFTYVHYLRLEKGTKVPRPEWMGPFLLALRLTPGEEGCRRMFLALLRDLLRTEEAFEMVLGPLLCRHPAAVPRPAGREALRWMKEGHAVHLSPEEFRAVASDESAYWCSEVLMSDRGSWSAAELAEVLALEERAVSGALRKLKAAGLVQESSKGRFKSRRAGKFYTFPGRLPGMRVPFKAVRAYWERMFRRKGKEMADRVELVRASEGSVRGYVSGLFEALDAANTLATMEKGEDTGLFLIEAQVRKLTPL